MKFIDLFSGIGGIKIAFSNAGFECVFSNDFDKNAKITYDFNFSDKMLLEDIQKISTAKIPSFDILCGGFPCQPFSIAGYRQGFKDVEGRGNLFFDIVRILKAKKPKAIFAEVRQKLEKGLIIIDYRTLEPYELDHCMFICKRKG